MRNTFVFGIGGTGARVIRSLTMLLASGVEINHPGKIIPIIIDVDAENEDTSRTIKSLDLYKKIRTKAYGDIQEKISGFFGTNLNTLSSQKAGDDGKIKDEFQLKFAGVASTFGEYLKVEDLDNIDEEFLELLYGERTLCTMVIFLRWLWVYLSWEKPNYIIMDTTNSIA